MENLCMISLNPAKFSCECDLLLRFCSKHYNLNHKPLKCDQFRVNLQEKISEINEKALTNIEKLNKAKKLIVSKSSCLIDLISLITKKHLSFMEKQIKIHQNIIKNNTISLKIENIVTNS